MQQGEDIPINQNTGEKKRRHTQSVQNATQYIKQHNTIQLNVFFKSKTNIYNFTNAEKGNVKILNADYKNMYNVH